MKGLEEQGLNAFLWTGGYDVPPVSMMETVREDIMFIEEVIGVGEVAISGQRALAPSPTRRFAPRHPSPEFGGGAGGGGQFQTPERTR